MAASSSRRPTPRRTTLLGRSLHTQLYVSNSTTDTPPPYNPPDYLPEPPSRNKYGSINLTSSPSRCDVYINDRFRGVTPLKVDLAPGQYDIMVIKSGYEPWRQFTAGPRAREGTLLPPPRTLLTALNSTPRISRSRGRPSAAPHLAGGIVRKSALERSVGILPA